MRRNLSTVISLRFGRVPLMHITSAPWSTFECIADTCACSWPTRHQREHQSAAAPIPAQERRPVHAHPGRAQLCRRGSQPPPASSARVGNPGRGVRYCRAHADAAWACVAVRFSAAIMTAWPPADFPSSTSPAYNVGVPTRSPSMFAARSASNATLPTASDHL